MEVGIAVWQQVYLLNFQEKANISTAVRRVPTSYYNITGSLSLIYLPREEGVFSDRCTIFSTILHTYLLNYKTFLTYIVYEGKTIFYKQQVSSKYFVARASKLLQARSS